MSQANRLPLLRFVLSVSLTLSATFAAPVERTTQAATYLSKFGYLPPANPANGGLLDSKTWLKAITDFQRFAGINVTGELDGKTVEVMGYPRCGMQDNVGSETDSRSSRFVLQGGRWETKALTYKITKYPTNLNRHEVDAEIVKAFSVWSDYTDLTFTAKRTNPVDIEIRFEEGEHGDRDPFDGAGGVLAHAYFPSSGGDAHFDDDEDWSINSAHGTTLLQVAAHEFGHSLGLTHSDVGSAVMAPFYMGYDSQFRLDSDDIQGIQALYGKKNSGGRFDPVPAPKPQPRPNVPSDHNELCEDSKIDTAFNTHDGATYVFKGNSYYKLTENAIADGYPKLISQGWPGLPGNIDAAFTYSNEKTYFFRGSKYWRYSGRQMDGGYPKNISYGFTGIPDYLDGAQVWGGNGKIYFYKGTKYWRFDPMQRPPVKSTYPKPLSNWAGVPNNIDGAFPYSNGYTYFFKGNKYYRFNDRRFSVDAANPPFPRSTARWWFGCTSSFDSNENVIASDRTDRESNYYVGDNRL